MQKLPALPQVLQDYSVAARLCALVKEESNFASIHNLRQVSRLYYIYLTHAWYSRLIHNRSFAQLIAGPNSFFALTTEGDVYETEHADQDTLVFNRLSLKQQRPVKQVVCNFSQPQNDDERLYQVFMLGEDGRLYSTGQRKIMTFATVDQMNVLVEDGSQYAKKIDFLDADLQVEALMSFSHYDREAIGLVYCNGTVYQPIKCSSQVNNNNSNNKYQFSDTRNAHDNPIKINGHVTKVACSYCHVFLLTEDNNLYRLGYNNAGQLAHARGQDPWQIFPLRGFKFRKPIIDIAVNDRCTIVLNTRGKVLHCGWVSNQDNSTEKFVTHKELTSHVTQIGAGYNHILVRDIENNVYGLGKLPSVFKLKEANQFVRIKMLEGVIDFCTGDNGVLYQTSLRQFFCTALRDAKGNPTRVITPRDTLEQLWIEGIKIRSRNSCNFELLRTELRQCWVNAYQAYSESMKLPTQKLLSLFSSSNHIEDCQALRKLLPTESCTLNDIIHYSLTTLLEDPFLSMDNKSPLKYLLAAIHESPIVREIYLGAFADCKSITDHQNHCNSWKDLRSPIKFAMPPSSANLQLESYRIFYKRYLLEFLNRIDCLLNQEAARFHKM